MSKKEDSEVTAEEKKALSEGNRIMNSSEQEESFNSAADDMWATNEGWENASAIIWQPEDGDGLEGVYDGSEPFVEGTLDTEVDKHYVKEKGSNIRYSFVGGQVFDKSMKCANLKRGDLVKIIFIGQRDCKAGRVNLFDIKFKRM